MDSIRGRRDLSKVSVEILENEVKQIELQNNNEAHVIRVSAEKFGAKGTHLEI
jgi:hypothetical protein